MIRWYAVQLIFNSLYKALAPQSTWSQRIQQRRDRLAGFRRALERYWRVLIRYRSTISMDPTTDLDDAGAEGRPVNGPATVEVLSVFWGQRYASMFARTCLPSLLQSGLSEIAMKTSTTIRIHCPAAEWGSVRESVHQTIGSSPIAVVWCPLEAASDMNKSEAVPVIRQHFALANACDGIVVFAMPDLVFGRGLGRVIGMMKRGDYVVCGQPRIALEAALEELAELMQENTYENTDLVNFFLDRHPHSIVRRALSGWHGYLRIRRSTDKYVAYFKEPPPLMCWGSPDLIEDGYRDPYFGPFECVDHDIPNVMFLNRRLRIIDDSDLFFWGELTSTSEYEDMIDNDFWLESAIFLSDTPLHWRWK